MVAQCYNYNCNKIELGIKFQHNLKSSSKIGLGLGWLCAVAQGYIYSYTKTELVSNFQNNLRSWNTIGSGLGWLRAVARGYNYGYSKIELGSNFQNNNIKSCGVIWSWGLDGCAWWRKVIFTVIIKLSWGVILKKTITSCRVKSR